MPYRLTSICGVKGMVEPKSEQMMLAPGGRCPAEGRNRHIDRRRAHPADDVAVRVERQCRRVLALKLERRGRGRRSPVDDPAGERSERGLDDVVLRPAVDGGVTTEQARDGGPTRYSSACDVPATSQVRMDPVFGCCAAA